MLISSKPWEGGDVFCCIKDQLRFYFDRTTITVLIVPCVAHVLWTWLKTSQNHLPGRTGKLIKHTPRWEVLRLMTMMIDNFQTSEWADRGLFPYRELKFLHDSEPCWPWLVLRQTIGFKMCFGFLLQIRSWPKRFAWPSGQWEKPGFRKQGLDCCIHCTYLANCFSECFVRLSRCKAPNCRSCRACIFMFQPANVSWTFDFFNYIKNIGVQQTIWASKQSDC